MADKPSLSTVSGNAVYSAATLNAIFDDLATAIEGCLGRGGTGESPNSMSGVLDMNTNRIQNVGDPVANQDAVTKAWVVTNYGSASVEGAQAAQAAAEAAQAAAEAAQTAAETSADFVDDLYLGAKASAPSVDNDGDAIQTGAQYYNTTDGIMYVRTSGGSWTQAYTDAAATPSATTSAEGKIEIATDAEAVAKTATNKAIVPSNLASGNFAASDTFQGLVELATDAETEGGTDTGRALTPANLNNTLGTNYTSGVSALGAYGIYFIGNRPNGTTPSLYFREASTSYSKQHSIKLPVGGTIDVEYSTRSVSGAHTVYSRVYVNGIAVGTEDSTSSTSYSVKTQLNITVNAGDTVELWAKADASSEWTGSWFAIYSDSKGPAVAAGTQY